MRSKYEGVGIFVVGIGTLFLMWLLRYLSPVTPATDTRPPPWEKIP